MSIDILVENYSCRNLCSGVYNDIVERSLDSCQISAQKKQLVMDAIEIWLRDGEKCGFRSLAQKSVVRDRRESVNAHVRKVEQDIARDQDRAAEEWLSWLVTVDAHRACGQVEPALSDSHPGYNTNGKYSFFMHSVDQSRCRGACLPTDAGRMKTSWPGLEFLCYQSHSVEPRSNSHALSHFSNLEQNKSEAAIRQHSTAV
jgi:hypothetical protein